MTITTSIAILTQVNAQSEFNYNDFAKLSGTWVYETDDSKVTIILYQKTVHFPHKDVEYLLGFSKLEKNNEVLYDNFDLANKLIDRSDLSISELHEFTVKYKGPDIKISFENASFIGSYYVYNHSKALGFYVSSEENIDIMRWKFSYYIGGGTDKNLNHFPAVPSTWVLKRIE